MGSLCILVFGATGTLGQALMAEGLALGHDMRGAARRHGEYPCDLTDRDRVTDLWRSLAPDVVINTAALIDVGACEANPDAAYGLHAHGVHTLARLARETRTPLVQVSTDQYYHGDGIRPHGEGEPVHPQTVYAASKLAGEALAATAPDHLIIRTNFTGMRGWEGRPSFAEWAIDVILNARHATLFNDYFTSTIDAPALAQAIMDLIGAKARGVLNVAAAQVFSKADFVEALARRFARPLPHAIHGSVAGLVPARSDSLGLDVTRAERLLGRPLPRLEDVVHALHRAWQDQKEADPCGTTRLSA
ncbi:MAG: SDR family oxidoreductase [Alphaproteobacteria bacterium]